MSGLVYCVTFKIWSTWNAGVLAHMLRRTTATMSPATQKVHAFLLAASHL